MLDSLYVILLLSLTFYGGDNRVRFVGDGPFQLCRDEIFRRFQMTRSAGSIDIDRIQREFYTLEPWNSLTEHINERR